MHFRLAYGSISWGLKNTKDKTETGVLQAFKNKQESFAKNCGYSLKDLANQSTMPPRLHEADTFNTLKVRIDSRIAGSMRTSRYFD